MDFLPLVAALIGALWLVWFAVRGSLIAAALACLLTICCFGYPFLHIDGGPFPLTIDRLALVALIGIYILQRALGQTEPKPLGLVDTLLLAFLAVLTLSTFTHQWHDLPVGDVLPLWRLCTGFFTPAIIYWVARQSRLTARQVGLAQGALALFGVYLAVTGLLEAAKQWSFVFPRYIADPSVGLHFGRARGPMVQAVSYGLCLSVTMLAGWAWRMHGGWRSRVLWLSFVSLQLAALYFTYTRSVWIGTALLVLVVLGLVLRGRWRVAVLGPLLAGALLMALVNFRALTDLQREGSAVEAHVSASMRESFAYVSWQMFLDRPLFGWGFGQFYVEKNPYLSDRGTPLELELIREYINHNTYLNLLAETGIVGFGLYMAVLAGWLRAGWQLTRSGNPAWVRWQGVLLLGALATYGVQMMFHEVSYTAIDNSLIFFLAGLTVGLRRTAQPQARSTAREMAAVSRVQPKLRSSRLGPFRAAGCSLLRRWPRLYAAGHRWYGALSFWLRIPHEPDFRLFAALEGVAGLFVDVGANSGQSARSLRVFNRSLDILSFEPNRFLEPDLRFTRRLLGPNFRYRMQGLGSAPSRTTLYVPQRGHTPQTPWATQNRARLESDHLAIERELGGPFEIVETPIEVQRFDDLNLHPLIVKIDVEGLELDVLQGMEATLHNDEPLLMVEQNQGSAIVADWLEARGYLIWSYDSQQNRLRPRCETPVTTNFIACTAVWLERQPQVRALIGASSIRVAAAQLDAALQIST